MNMNQQADNRHESTSQQHKKKQPRITVIGSLNMDLVTTTSNVPSAGETVNGEAFSTMYGGKGANQAVACARLGAEVHMLGCVGSDSFGQEMLSNLKSQSIHCEHVKVLEDQSSGIAAITIADGDNRIIVVPGANGAVTPAYVRQHEQRIADSDLLLLQLEIPLEAVTEAVNMAHKYQVPVMLNPAPAQLLPDSLIEKITWLTPNEHELLQLFQSNTGEDQLETAYRELVASMPEKIIMTKGSDGALWSDNKGTVQHTPGHSVKVADTTGAGDTFNGALAVALAEGRSLHDAVHWAVGAGALSVMKFGAQGGMPLRSELDAWLSLQSNN